MKDKRISTPYDELTYKIIGCAMSVHRNLGPGLKEKTYQKDLEEFFNAAALDFESQKLYEIYNGPDHNLLIGYYIPDFVVENKVVVEIKALKGLDNSHLSQVIGYLAVTACPIALLLNFGTRSLQYRRIFPPEDITTHYVNRQWLFVPDWLRDK